MQGFYLIDKPTGMTSFDVLRILRKKLDIKKMGHTGTLDPLATGCLLVAVGNYTKLIPFFEQDTKTYECVISLDGKSSSYDSDTPVAYLPKEQRDLFSQSLTRPDIEQILQTHFTGTITQVPPKYSAIKVGGKKALMKVKSGEEFELPSRKVTIYGHEIVDFSYPILKLKLKVSAGTYIRSIASDLGNILGTGGYITDLRRTEVGKLSITQSQNLDAFDGDNTLPIETLFDENRIVTFGSDEIQELNFGRKFSLTQKQTLDGIYLLKQQDAITHIVEISKGIVSPKRKI